MMFTLAMALLIGGAGLPTPERPGGSAIVLPFQPLQLRPQQIDGDGYLSDGVAWSDGDAQRREAELVRNDVQDPSGNWGGYVRRLTYQVDGAPRTCVGSSNKHPGFGYLVNHVRGGSVSSRWHRGHAPRIVLQGAHHAILERSWTYPIDGHPVTATAHWLFATGRSHPLFAVTFDTSAAPPDAVRADTRAPYGDIAWDGGVGADVDGVAWGERFVFATLDAPVTPSSGWDYTTPNTVPFTLAFSIAADAEMGLVQTQTQDQHDAGGYWGYGSRNTRNARGPMPEPGNWAFQINQWELPDTAASKRMAWGSNYGAVGQRAYPSLGDDRELSGYPYQSYSTYVVLGQHSRSVVARQVHQIEAVQRTTLEVAGAGSIAASGPGGVGRDDDVPYDRPGFNPTYGTWEVQRTSGAEGPLQLRFEVRGGQPLEQPILVVRGWGEAGLTLRRDGAGLRENVDFVTSRDPATKALWITLLGTLPAGQRTELSLEADATRVR